MSRPDTQDVLIMLYVDTVAIQEPGANALDCVFIASNWTDPESPTQTPTDPGGKTDFLTDVFDNSQIAWVGAVKDIVDNSDHYVLITGVTIPQGKDGIGITISNPESGSGSTHIDGRSYNGRAGTTTYTINFSVGQGNQIVGDYSIDPQLRMN